MNVRRLATAHQIDSHVITPLGVDRMLDWTVLVPTFLTAAVEWVEAFTIVLAVGNTVYTIDGSDSAGHVNSTADNQALDFSV